MSGGEPVIVLNVDDRDALRYVKTRDLELGGYVVLEARNGAEALQTVERHRPPVVLLDVQLPDISGFDVCRYIKMKWPEIMVLMTSATFVSSSDRTLGLDSGADSYLIQPAEPLELAAAVNALLRIRRSEDALRALNESLEKRVQERTNDLAEANVRLSAEIVERQKSEAALVRAQKMEAIGQLTSGIAHDFNNLLTAVIGNLDLIRSRSGETNTIRRADNALKAAERGSKLTSQLLAFSRTQALATSPVNVNALIADMRQLLAQTLGASVVVETRLHPDQPMAMADFNQLELAILNLSINARDAMPEGGTITIATGIVAETTPEMVQVTISDTGTGMTPEVALRAFDPFFTTKPIGKGTGLGLSQVYGIVRQCGGDVAIDSEIGKGTTVILRLPRTFQSETTVAADAATATQPGNTERILLVEDDPDVLELVGSILKELGYQVRHANGIDAVLGALDEFDPALLLIDYAMPGANGAEVVQACRQRKPNLRVLFLSGFADSGALEAAVQSAPLLRKPFLPAQLAAKVRTLLDIG